MRRTTVVAVGVLAGITLLSGCGALPTGTGYKAPADVAMSPAAAVRAASEATGKVGTVRLRLALTSTGGATPAAITVEGPMSLDGRTADLTVTLPAGTFGSTGAVTVRQVVVEGAAYLKVEGSDLVPATWIRIDGAGEWASAGLGTLGSLVSGTGVADQLAALRGLGDVTTVGTESLDGADTTHYRATIDPSKVAGSLAGLGGLSGLRDLGGLTGPTGAGTASTIPVDLWVDGEGRAVRMTQTLAGEGAEKVTWQIDLSDFGAPLSVTAPAGAIDVGALLGDIAEGLSGLAAAGS